MRDIFEGLNGIDVSPELEKNKKPDIFEGLNGVDVLPEDTSMNSEPQIGYNQQDDDQEKAERIANALRNASGRSPLDVFLGMPDEKKQETFNDLLRIAVKAPAATVGSLADMVTTLPYNLGVAGYNALTGDNKPQSKTLEHVAEEGIDTVTGGKTKGGGPIYEGTKLALSLAIPGATGAKLVQKAVQAGKEVPKAVKALNFFGSTDPKVIASAVPAGAAMEIARKNDAGLLTEMGIGVGTGLAAQRALTGAVGLSNFRKRPGDALMAAGDALKGVASSAKELPYKIAKVGLGIKKSNFITKSNFNEDIAKAFLEAGLQAPVSAVTDSRIVGLANKTLSKVPYLAEWVSKRHKELEEGFTKYRNDLGEKIGPQKTDAISKQTSSLFKEMIKLAPEGALMDISGSVKKAEEIVSQLRKAASNDSPSKKTIEFLEPFLARYKEGKGTDSESLINFVKSDFFKNMGETQKQSALKALNISELQGVAPTNHIVEQYQQLNSFMGEKDLFKGDNGKRNLNLLHEFRRSLKADLAIYGKENPEFDKVRKQANKLFSQTKKRQEWDRFWEKYQNATQDTQRYKPLTEALHKTEVKEKLTRLLGKDLAHNLEIITKASKGMAKSALNDPNPSGTELQRMVNRWGSMMMNTLTGGGASLATGSPVPLLLMLGGPASVAWALQSRNFVKKLVEYSEKPSVQKGKILERIVMKNTGLTLEELNKDLKDSLEKYQSEEPQ